MTTKRSDDLRALWLILLVAGIGVLLYLLTPILTPFLFAGILAYICDPLVDRLERLRWPRTLGVLAVMVLLFLVFIGLILILVPLIEMEVRTFLQRLPSYLDWIKTGLLPWFNQLLGAQIELDTAALKEALTAHWQSAGGALARALPSLTSGGLAVFGWFANVILVPVVLFYLLRDWDHMVARLDEMIPRPWHERVATLAREIDAVLAEFLRGQISVMVLMAVFYVLGLWIVGLDYALPIGLMAGLLVFVPYLGMIIGLTLATIAGLTQFGSIVGLIPVWVVFAIGQALEGMVVTPWLVGDRIGLHPVVVIFSLLAFGQIFGFFGILLALPVSAALLVWLRHLHRHYMASSVYND
jgi:predicted PurR-regulated permease PerM